MRRVAIGLASAAALTMATAAQATVTIGGSTNVLVTKVLQNSTNATIDFTSPVETAGTLFTNNLTFTNSASGLYNLTVQTLAGSAFVNFTSCLGCGIFLSGTGILGSIPIGLSSTANGASTFAQNNINLGAGTFTLTLKGMTTSLGDFNGIVDFSAVPEPGTWGLMLLGFAAIGASIRRRRFRNLSQLA